MPISQKTLPQPASLIPENNFITTHCCHSSWEVITLSVCLSLSVCFSLSVPVCLPACLCLCLCLCVSVSVSVWMSVCLSLPESCKAVMKKLLFYGKLPRKRSLSRGRSSRPKSSVDGRLVPLPAFLRLSFDSPVSSRRWTSKCHGILHRLAHTHTRTHARTHARTQRNKSTKGHTIIP